MKNDFQSNLMKLFFIPLFVWVCSPCLAEDRPNILFCMADDWGWPHAGAYGDEGVKTPNFDRIAKEGALFHHAYVSSPSCTPSRNSVITGKFHWELGPGANLWSTLPVEHESFIHILRDSGYVTGRNEAKTWGPGNIEPWIAHHGDHPATTSYKTFTQFLDKTEAKEKPFFFWLATSDPHRAYVKGSGKADGIDPAKAHLFKHFPDTDTVRNDIADYYFEVQRWDKLVGSAIAELEKHGLLENTIIIMTSDNGMPFPRSKANLYDSGVRMPFAIRWGKGIPPNRQIEDFISLAGIAPTLLELTETPVPKNMTGQSFTSLLRSEKSGRIDPAGRPDIVFGRERHTPAQEAPEMGGYPARALRTTDFLYIRNYLPERWPTGHGNAEKANMPGQWYADCDASPTKNYIYENRDKDDAHRRAFELSFAKRPVDELYDLKKDPDQIHNIAANPESQEALTKMKTTLQTRLTHLNDPRATDPAYPEFDKHPYYGGGGGMRDK
jgi:N-sulfoglucosamine sulfohydrolase